MLGPQRRHARRDRAARRVPVTWQGDRIAELAVDGAPEEDSHVPRARRRARRRPLPRRLGHRRRVLGPLSSRCEPRARPCPRATGRRSFVPSPLSRCNRLAPGCRSLDSGFARTAPDPSNEGTARLNHGDRRSLDRGTPPRRTSDPRSRDVAAASRGTRRRRPRRSAAPFRSARSDLHVAHLGRRTSSSPSDPRPSRRTRRCSRRARRTSARRPRAGAGDPTSRPRSGRGSSATCRRPTRPA